MTGGAAMTGGSPVSGRATGGVVVVGSVNIDLTAFTPRRPEPGETVLGRSLSTVLGGKGANQAIAAARAGARTTMIGCVGQDRFADLALAGLAAEGVDTAAVTAVPGPTGVAHIRVDDLGENDIVVLPQANAALTPAAVERALRGLAPRPGVLLLQLEVPLDAVLAAARVGHELGLTVVLDPSPVPPAPLPDALWADVDLVKPNLGEAARLTGAGPPDRAPLTAAAQAGRWFIDRGVQRVVLTAGAEGAVVLDGPDGAPTGYPPHPVDVVDPTAAGDAFVGHLGAGLAAGLDWTVAVRRATAAGALAVTVAGASPSLPTSTEVDALLRGSADRLDRRRTMPS
jgi:ribokinase